MQTSEELPLGVACFGIQKPLQHIVLEAKGKKEEKNLEVYLKKTASNFLKVPSPTLLIHLHCGILWVMWTLK